MQATQPMIHQFELGDLVDPIHPVFAATMNGMPALVRLDNAALFKLGSRISADALPSLLDDKRPMIASAARRLIEDGFWIETEAGYEVHVTAIDF